MSKKLNEHAQHIKDHISDKLKTIPRLHHFDSNNELFEMYDKEMVDEIVQEAMKES